MKKIQKTLDKKQKLYYIITMNNINERTYTELHWISADTARRLIETHTEDPAFNAWNLDLFTLLNLLKPKE